MGNWPTPFDNCDNCIPFKATDGSIAMTDICMDGVMYVDHYCNRSLMGLIAFVITACCAMVGLCGLKLFMLPLFMRCMRCCCKCCFDEDVKGVTTIETNLSRGNKKRN